MAYEIPGDKIGTLNAGADFSEKQFYAVEQTATDVELPADGKSMLGVLQNKPLEGQPCEIMTSSVTKAVGGDAIAKGKKVAISGGKFIEAVATKVIVGTALDACGADGELFTLEIGNEGIMPA